MEATLNFGWDAPIGPRRQDFARAFGFGPTDAEPDRHPGKPGRGRGRGRGRSGTDARWTGGRVFSDTDPGDDQSAQPHPGGGRGRAGHGMGHGPRGRGPRGGWAGMGREFADFADEMRRGGPRHFGGRGRARRGDVRTAALLLIAEEPRNGYQVITALAERTGGAWKPSPGAIYPALNQLEDEGLIAPTSLEGRKAFQITEAGTEQVAALADQPAPWEQVSEQTTSADEALLVGLRDLGMAVRAVVSTGDAALAARAAEQLDQAKKAVYSLLAEH